MTKTKDPTSDTTRRRTTDVIAREATTNAEAT
jgi:hypothetical protein